MVGPWAHGDFIRVRRSSSWSVGDGPATVPEVLFNVRSADAAYADFALGRLDWAPVPAGAVDAAVAEYGLVEERGTGVLDVAVPQLYFLGMDLSAPPLDDRDVRRALSLAIDRRALARASRDGAADPAISAVPPAVPGGAPSGCGACRYDPDQSRDLFAAAGVTELTLWFNDGGGHEQIAALVAQQLADVGVTLRTESTGPSLADYLDTLRAGEASLFRFGWTAEHPTLDAALRPLLSRNAAGQEGAANYGRYADAEVEALLDSARADPDWVSRVAGYARVQDLALDRDQAIVPLLTLRQVRLVSARTRDLALDVTGAPELERIRLRPGSGPE
jgi:peptide/nickel transport system substrate-binding protein/oligopeptide transport system substrate-binding protein